MLKGSKETKPDKGKEKDRKEDEIIIWNRDITPSFQQKSSFHKDGEKSKNTNKAATIDHINIDAVMNELNECQKRCIHHVNLMVLNFITTPPDKK